MAEPTIQEVLNAQFKEMKQTAYVPQVSQPFKVSIEETKKLEAPPMSGGILEAIFSELQEIRRLLVQQAVARVEPPVERPVNAEEMEWSD